MTKTEEREQAKRQEQLEAREGEALDELHKLGFRVTLHEMGRYVEADELLGVRAGYRPGTCYAVMYGRDGKRKHVSGRSALEALQQAQAWSRWQASLKDDAANKFVPSVDHEFVPAASVTQQVVGDTAETRMRRENTERRIISFASGTAEIVDSHGDPLGEGIHASQYREADSEGDMSR